MGESIKPVVPGSRPDKGVEEPETKSESTSSAAATATQWGVLHRDDATEAFRLIGLI